MIKENALLPRIRWGDDADIKTVKFQQKMIKQDLPYQSLVWIRTRVGGKDDGASDRVPQQKYQACVLRTEIRSGKREAPRIGYMLKSAGS